MSVWSNIAYVIAGFLSADPVFIIAMSLLGLGSAYSHKTNDWIYDWMGMYVAFGSIILKPLPFVFALYAPVISYLTYVLNFYSYVFLGVLWASGWALTGFDSFIGVWFGVALMIRQIGQVKHYEILHSVWHLMSAYGLYRMYYVIG